jgi:hypothetical protein
MRRGEEAYFLPGSNIKHAGLLGSLQPRIWIQLGFFLSVCTQGLCVCADACGDSTTTEDKIAAATNDIATINTMIVVCFIADLGRTRGFIVFNAFGSQPRFKCSFWSFHAIP